MAFTVTELITRSFYLSNVVASGQETVSGDQLEDGLNMLNAFLAAKTADKRLIPYFKPYVFIAIIGQETYFIPDLIATETLSFTISTVRYPMELIGRNDFFGTARANNVESLPYQYFVERALGGANLSMYFLPNQAYEFTLHGKFSLANVVLNQDLSLILDQYYLDYLRYGLAEYICQEYNIQFQPQQAMYLKRLEKTIYDTSPIDFTTKKKSTLQQKQGADIYGQVNIGKGWTRAM